MLLFAFAVAGPATASETRIEASDVAMTDRFGGAVAVSGDVAVLGAFFADVDGKANQGAAYVFRFDGSSWVEEQKLVASDGVAGERFGSSVAVLGDVVLVGARFAGVGGNVAQGAAYVFRHDGSSWVEEQKLTAPNGAISDEFGASAALSGNVAAVGADRADGVSVNSGAVQVFRFDGTSWVHEQQLVASDGGLNEGLGWSLALAGDTIVAGAPFAEIDGNARQGTAYVFGFDGSQWTEEQKLTGSDTGAEDTFGFHVALSEGVALVGAIGANPSLGEAYVFGWNGTAFVEEQTLTASNGELGDFFGGAVALRGAVAVVGAPLRNSRQGAAYVFRRSGSSWLEQAELTASDGDPNDQLGGVAALSDEIVLLGAELDEPGGAGYIFSLGAPVPATSVPGRALLGVGLALLGGAAITLGARGRGAAARRS